MHGDCHVPQHGFRPGGGDGDPLVACFPSAFHRVADRPQRALHLAAFHLQVGDRGLELGVPVHQPAVAVDQPLAVQADEHFSYGVGQPSIHGEPLARPVERGAEPAQLPGDRAARLRLPRPHPADELLAPQRLPGRAGGGELALHHHLGRDAGMVGAGLPQRVPPLHPPPADQHVLQRVVQRVADVQRPGDVGRRDHDGVRLRAAARPGGERAAGFPGLVERGLGGGGIEGLFQHGLVLERAAEMAKPCLCHGRQKRKGVRVHAADVAVATKQGRHPCAAGQLARHRPGCRLTARAGFRWPPLSHLLALGRQQRHGQVGLLPGGFACIGAVQDGVVRWFGKTTLVGWAVLGGLVEMVLPAKVAAKRGLA